MLEDTLHSLNQLQAALQKDACVPKEPFVKLGDGAAPTLNYNIPQTTCFSTYGNMRVRGVQASDFLGYTQEAPKNNFFQRVDAMPVEVLQQKFGEAVQLQTAGSDLLPNNELIRKHLDMSRTNLDAIAVGATAPVVNVSGNSETSFTGGESVLAASEAIRTVPLMREATNAINEVQLARIAKEGQMPYVVQKLGGFETRMAFLPKPPKADPYFVVIEEYRTCSYLGDYGAGRTVKTFSLLPGEKTTITMRTYRDMTSTREYSENVLDSFSEASTNEMEKNIENENSIGSSYGSTSSSSNSGSSNSSSSHNWNVSASVSGGLSKLLGISAKAGGGGSYSNGSSSAFTNSSSNTGSRTANVKAVDRALDKHVASSNANRQININTTTNDTSKEGEENTTVRELTNFNKSRVLNFVFRQLLQEYLTITSLVNIRIAYCNGYAESLRVVDLEQLDELLADTVVEDRIEDVRNAILKSYCTVTNFQDDEVEFIEKVSVNYGQCLGINETETFWRIKKGLEDRYSSGGLDIKVNGVILSVGRQTLRTSSVVVDALLGQGEALDCYNQKSQDAAAIGEQLKNLTLLQQIELIEGIKDPQQKVELYKKVFGSCCDVPQTQVIS